jgi:crotonobetaine/carnitine-CoA ligase
LLLRGRPADPLLVWEPVDGPGATWTYGRFAADAARLAAGLSRCGLAPGDRIALLLDNSPEFLLAWTAVTLAGGVAVCLNTASTRDDLSYYAGHAGISGAVAGPSHMDLLGAAMPSLRWLVSGAALPFGDAADLRRPAPDPDRPASIQYTSGTTARPKAVVWSAANCAFAGATGARHQGLTAADVNLVHLPLFHTNALSYSFLSTAYAGGTVVLQPRFSASRFWAVAVRNRCTWTAMISFTVRALAARPAPPVHSFRGWGNSFCLAPGTGPGGVGAMGWFGMTETVSHPICGSPDSFGMPGTMGRAAPEYGVRVVTDDGVPVEPGGTGTLHVRGERGRSLFAGYLGDAAATAAAFVDGGWFVTGDRVRREPDGSYVFVERDKDVLKVGGENVGAPEIERVLLGVAGVREAAVVGRPHEMLGEVPVAFLLVSGPAAQVRAAAAVACEARLPRFKRPVEIVVLEEFPRSVLEKVAKAELRRLAQG